jgi:hypothetical protein
MNRAMKEERGDEKHAMGKMLSAGSRGNTDAMRMRADEMLGSKSKYIEREKKGMERNDYKEKAEGLRVRADHKTANSMRKSARSR